MIGITLLIVSSLLLGEADACGRRRRSVQSRVVVWRPPTPPWAQNPPRPGGIPPIIVVPPPVLMTPQPSQQPTSFPTAFPTRQPTKQPTPPPPPPPFKGFIPTPDIPTTPFMTRTNCVKRVEFGVSAGSNGDIEEKWRYTCSYNVYVVIDLSTISEPTNCACGLTIDHPDLPKNGVVETAYRTRIENARLVVYNENRNVVIRDLPEFPLQVNVNTTKELQSKVMSNDNDLMKVVAGFSGLVMGFPEMPAILNTQIQGQEHNVPALCFGVVQEFLSKYQWPEPPFPQLDSPPSLYETGCTAFNLTTPFDYPRSAKRDVEEGSRPRLYFKEYLVFTKQGVTLGGFNAKNRYITSFFTSNLCDKLNSYVSIDRHFISTVTRTPESYGTFRWLRQYTQNFLVGGAPSGFSSVNNFLADGYFVVEWYQPYSEAENGSFRPGVLAAALTGKTHPNNPDSGPEYKLCSKVPAAWTNCQLNTAQCARTDPTFKNNKGAVHMWPTFKFGVSNDVNNEALKDLDCKGAFEVCQTEETWLTFQNFGAAARDFSKTATSHLLTGPRNHFCQSIASGVTFDTLVFKPRGATGMMRKREDLLVVNQAVEHSIHNDFSRKRNGNIQVLEAMADPVAAGLPTMQNVQMQPAVGSANEEGRAASANAGDHPIQLFPETFTAPLTVRDEDRACGLFGKGTFDTTGCEAKLFVGAPPCIEGQLGCSCRRGDGVKCDPPSICNNNNYCIKDPCPAGQQGCFCDAAGACQSGLKCDSDKRCVNDDSICVRGTAGCRCNADNSCAAGSTCASGICAVSTNDGCAVAGTAGCGCAANGGCSDSNMVCNPSLSLCVSRSFCVLGSPGCDCKGNRCASGFECSPTGKCRVPECVAGSRGCPCKADNTCSEPNYSCTALTLDGSSTACLAKVICDDQTQRCENYCGKFNVLRCPACAHERPQCITANSASAPSLSFAALLVLALFALLA